MNTEKLNVNFAEGENVKELIIRETTHVNEPLPILEPDHVEITGNIDAPARFLEKRWNNEQVEHSRTHLIVNRDELRMTLIANETDKRNRMTIVGRIRLSRQFAQFGINSEKEWEPEDLGNLFRINRTYFENREENMQLVTKLKSFKAKIQTEVEREKKDNGSVTDVYRKVVDSNLPESFPIRIPIYKGAKPETINVEIIATVNGRDVTLSLISPDAASVIEEVRDRLIDEQISIIVSIATEIPIIEV